MEFPYKWKQKTRSDVINIVDFDTVSILFLSIRPKSKIYLRGIRDKIILSLGISNSSDVITDKSRTFLQHAAEF